MPDYTVSGDVDSMLRSANDAAIRSAIGVGTTDAPTFLAITLNDTPLVRDAPGILAQRNGTAAQAFRVYNTFPGTTANEWFEIDWKTTANTVRLFTNQGGTGGQRAMDISAGATLFLGAGSSSPIRMYSGGVERWQISSIGHFLAATDNLYDIGASGANRPRNIYLANSVYAPGQSFLNGVNLSTSGGQSGFNQPLMGS